MTDITTTHYLYKGETTNGCICTEFDKNIADWIPRAECYGYCWEDQAEEFHNSIEEFMQGNPTHDFVITGFPVWYGDVSGVFEARTSMEFLSAVTVNGDWTLRWEVTPEAFVASLSHHDGSGRITVVHAPEEVI
jgi:hypothetical protein